MGRVGHHGTEVWVAKEKPLERLLVALNEQLVIARREGAGFLARLLVRLAEALLLGHARCSQLRQARALTDCSVRDGLSTLGLARLAAARAPCVQRQVRHVHDVTRVEFATPPATTVVFRALSLRLIGS